MKSEAANLPFAARTAVGVRRRCRPRSELLSQDAAAMELRHELRGRARPRRAAGDRSARLHRSVGHRRLWRRSARNGLHLHVRRRRRRSSTRSHSYPESLLRVGMFADWFELRVDWNYAEERSNEFGGRDHIRLRGRRLGPGLKLALTPQECILPETAIILQMTVPTGSSDIHRRRSASGLQLPLRLGHQRRLVDRRLDAAEPAVDDETGDAYVEFAQSWTVDRSWTDHVSSYAEWYVLSTVQRRHEPYRALLQRRVLGSVQRRRAMGYPRGRRAQRRGRRLLRRHRSLDPIQVGGCSARPRSAHASLPLGSPLLHRRRQPRQAHGEAKPEAARCQLVGRHLPALRQVVFQHLAHLRRQSRGLQRISIISKLSRIERLSKLAVPTAAKSSSTRITFWCMKPGW